ncbi:MAG: FtsW/RodA/SpoVE family cell cycle protein [Lachnospiraceae bacterium]|nr:FtsW/RodA/SpoVE family cell cycle protein [Lachnospiraceae bacterium]
MIRQYRLRDYNFRLVLWLGTLSALGVLLVGSAEVSLQRKQMFGVISGMVLMIVISLIDFSWVLNFTRLLYLANLAMLAAVRFAGHSSHGAQRWITIGGLRFQPVELSKIIIILFFAKFFMDHENDLNKFSVVLRALLLLALPLILVYLQPDMKDTITITAVFAVMYYAAGLSYKYIGAVLIVVIPLVVIFMSIVIQPEQTLIKDYQRKRIMAFLYPDNEEYTDDTTQQNNSVIAIGSGMLSGKGLNNSDVDSANKGNFISEIETDFIFAVAGEELGFLGSVGIVILLLLIVLECLLISVRSKDLSGKVICCGLAALVSLQSFINIGVATRMLPNTGTPLPFVSYGITSIWTLFMGMGVVLNVGLQSKVRFVVPADRRRGMERGDRRWAGRR